jgi:hypothetical protein
MFLILFFVAILQNMRTYAAFLPKGVRLQTVTYLKTSNYGIQKSSWH